jgi:signal transduction histidine kinase
MWQVGFWLFLAGGVARLLTAADLSTGRRVTGLVTLVVIGLAYAILRPSPVADRVVPDVGYPLVVVVGAGLLCAVDPTLSILLTIFYSQMWLFAQRDRTAVLFVVGLSVSCTIGLTLNEPFSVEALVVNALIMLVSLAFSVIVGLWLTGIIDQSRERADLIRELESTRDQLGEAHHAQGVMAERERMAREIHDTLAQGYTSIIMLAQAARLPGTPPHDTDGRLQTIEAVARENLDEARALVATFSPVGLDGAGLAEALHRLAGRFTAETGVVVDVVVDGELSGLPPHREVVLLRAAQEAMANVRRHADARAVRMTLSASAGQARVEVTDDGVGFAPSTAPGFGLTGMRDRVRDAGGSVDVASTPGQGTRVSVRVPVDVVGAGAGAGAGAEGPA